MKPSPHTFFKSISLLLLTVLLAACASATRWNDPYKKPPVVKQPVSTKPAKPSSSTSVTKRPSGKRPGTHTVRSGEGFWSIARLYGITVAQLTAWNNMSKNDVIFKGMKLKLYPPSGSSDSTAGRSTGSAGSASPSSATAIKLHWPLQGRIINKFNAENRTIKGLQIGGLDGQRIKAAASGKVVYAGSGLVGLGNVLIIKHDATHITAYGHNEKLLKIEGEAVSQGEDIAIIGQGPNNQTMLYFEVRKNGKPVDPMNYLK